MVVAFSEILVNPGTKIKDVLNIINQAPHKNLPSGIAIVVDDSNSLLGVITDGDVRRALLGGHDIEEPVTNVMNKNPIKYIYEIRRTK